MSDSEPLIHIVDDDQTFRASPARLLERAGYAVRTYACAGDFLRAEPGSHAAGCVVLDINLPGPSGLRR